MKTKKSVSKRLKLRKGGKVTRRSTSLGHSRANKRQTEINRRKKHRDLSLSKKIVSKYI